MLRLLVAMCLQPQAVAASRLRQCGKNQPCMQALEASTGLLLQPLEIIEVFLFSLILTLSNLSTTGLKIESYVALGPFCTKIIDVDQCSTRR